MVAKAQMKELVVASIACGCISIVLVCISIGTEQWVLGSGPTYANQSVSNILTTYFGLFGGAKILHVGPSGAYNQSIYLVCDVGENVCMFSCGTNPDRRQKDLQSFVDLNSGSVDQDFICSNSKSTERKRRSLPIQGREDAEYHMEFNQRNSSTVDEKKAKEHLMNFGAWLMTGVFLAVGLAFAGMAVVVGVTNIATTPISTWAGLTGVKIYHGLAAVALLLAICIWGGIFGSRMSEMPPLRDVLTEVYNLNHGVSLGFSYWLVFGGMLIHIASVVCLVLRDYLLERRIRRAQKIMEEVPTTGTIMLF